MNIYFLSLITTTKPTRRESIKDGRLPNQREEEVAIFPKLGIMVTKNGEKRVTIEFPPFSRVTFWTKDNYIDLYENWNLIRGKRNKVFSDMIVNIKGIQGYNQPHLSYLKRIKMSFIYLEDGSASDT
jgi:hypothetical protein